MVHLENWGRHSVFRTAKLEMLIEPPLVSVVPECQSEW